MEDRQSIDGSTNIDKQTRYISSLVADTQFYKRLCPSIGPSFSYSICWSMMIESKSVKMCNYDATVMIFCACKLAWGGEGMDGGSMPLPTHPQQYCDPASLVYILLL